MTSRNSGLLKDGLLQTGTALALAGATAGVIASSSWTRTEVAGRLAITGVVLFAIALVVGSPRFVGLATVPVLGGALIASALGAEPAWLRSIVLGCVWYVAVELAWEAIERRDGAQTLDRLRQSPVQRDCHRRASLVGRHDSRRRVLISRSGSHDYCCRDGLRGPPDGDELGDPSSRGLSVQRSSSVLGSTRATL